MHAAEENSGFESSGKRLISELSGYQDVSPPHSPAAALHARAQTAVTGSTFAVF